ncbi:hypothetical protein T484DRAFT_1833626 [Baffinella frigidus]|nr:hypothetical protein T484DRAFT_1833626 [Cryptophyta sp. CCMP2293]
MSLVLKMRVLELIEVFLAHQKGSPLVMSLIEPLLDVCGGVGAERVGQSAQQRVSFNAKAATLFATRLCKPKSVPVLQTQEDREELVELVARLLSRLAQPHQGELVSPAIMLLLRIAGASAANGSKESLTPLLVAELTALLDK